MTERINIEILERLQTIENKIDNTHLNNKYLSTKTLCDFVDISRKTIQKARQDGTLKYFKKNGKILYKKSDVENWIKIKSS